MEAAVCAWSDCKVQTGGQVYWAPVLVLGVICSNKKTRKTIRKTRGNTRSDRSQRRERYFVVLLDVAQVSRTVCQAYQALIPEILKKINSKSKQRKKGAEQRKAKDFRHDRSVDGMVVVHCAGDECSHRPDSWSGMSGTVLGYTPRRKTKKYKQ